VFDSVQDDGGNYNKLEELEEPALKNLQDCDKSALRTIAKM
jgi:hypothetical protein